MRELAKQIIEVVYAALLISELRTTKLILSVVSVRSEREVDRVEN